MGGEGGADPVQNLPFQKYLDALNTISEGEEFHILSQAAGDIWIESLSWLRFSHIQMYN